MAFINFHLVSPERVVYSTDLDKTHQVSWVDVPGSEGDFGVLPDHAPLVTTLRPGIVTIVDFSKRFAVRGGFAEVSNSDGVTTLTILADFAEPAEEVDRAVIAGQIKDTEEDLADTTDEKLRDKLRTQVEQLKTLQAALGQ
jgi:F-type H+-transporting ATPase subunit epsilon